MGHGEMSQRRSGKSTHKSNGRINVKARWRLTLLTKNSVGPKNACCPESRCSTLPLGTGARVTASPYPLIEHEFPRHSCFPYSAMPSSAFRGALKQRRSFSKSESVAFRMVSQEKETWQEKGKRGKTHYQRYICTLTAVPLLGSQKLGWPTGKLFLSHAIASPSVYRRFCVPYQGSTCSEMKQLLGGSNNQSCH